MHLSVYVCPSYESKPDSKSFFVKLDRAPLYANRGGSVLVEIAASGSVTGN